MQPDLRDFPEPIPSFQSPATPPGVDPTSGVFLHRCYSEDWQAAIMGALQQLLEVTTWDTDDPALLLLTQERADILLRLFMMECDDMPTGAIIFSAGETPPDGYLVCDGAAISRANYAALFAVCGTRFGAGDGSTTFNVPDLGGRVPLGVGQQPDSTAFAAGDHGGEETHTLITAEMPGHSHDDTGHAHTYGATLPLVALTGEEPVAVQNPLPGSTGTGYARLSSTGGDEAHNNLQPYLALLACIRY